ncbi:hypothetical protein CEXT_525141, partial [Caerostris extrusa]
LPFKRILSPVLTPPFLPRPAPRSSHLQFQVPLVKIKSQFRASLSLTYLDNSTLYHSLHFIDPERALVFGATS